MAGFGERVFDAVLGAKKGEERNKLGLFLLWAAGFVVFMLIVTVWARFGAASPEKYGQAGDFFGGMLNPILSFLAFMGVLYSIHLQRTDLAENEKQTQRQFENAERQRFETTFFQMLTVHNSIVNSLDLKKSGNTTAAGRDCFKVYYDRLHAAHAAEVRKGAGDLIEKIEDGYAKFWTGERQDLGHYMRFLFNFIRIVHEAEIPRNESDSEEPRKKFIRVLRSQISDYELVILFYNFFSPYGDKFRELSGKYDLLDNMPKELVFDPAHLDHRHGMGKIADLPAI